MSIVDGAGWGEHPGPGTAPPKPRPTPPASIPKPQLPPSLPTAQDLYVQSAEAGRVIPLAYGTVKFAGTVLERMAPLHLGYGTNNLPVAPVVQRQPSTAYTVGQAAMGGDSRAYLCTVAGTTSSAPGVYGTGSDIVDGTVHWAFIAGRPSYLQAFTIGLCEGTIAGIGKVWADKMYWSTLASVDHVLTWQSLLTGTQPQSRPAWADNVPGILPYADTYGSTALLMMYMWSDASNDVPNFSFEVQALLISAGADADPADIAWDLVTHARRGAGWSSSRLFPASFDASATSWKTYCTAAGFNLSWLIDSQESALALIQDLCRVTQTDCVTSGGQLKFVPRCDQTIGSFVPATTPLYDLMSDDLLEQLQVSRMSSTDTYNSVPVEYVERTSPNEYGRVIVDDPAMDDVDRRGLKRSTTVSVPMVMAQSTAIMLSRMLAQRSLGLRNAWTLRLPGWRYCLVEPTDILTVSDSVMGVSRAPVRVVSFEETVNPDGTSVITLECEDYPVGVAAAAQWTSQAGDGYVPNTSNPINAAAAVRPQATYSQATAPTGGVYAVGDHWYDTANGNKPYVWDGSAWVAVATDLGQLPGVLPVGSTTRGGDVDNIFPNPTCETAPPPGADTSQPEWFDRYNAGAGAYSGDWVRRCVAGASQVNRTIRIACMPGRSVYVEAQAKRISGSTGRGGGVYVWFNDKTGTVVGGASSTDDGVHDNYATTNAAWEKVFTSGTAPAATCTADIGYWADPNNTVDFDAIYARMMIDADVSGTLVSGRITGGTSTIAAQTGLLTATCVRHAMGWYTVSVPGLTANAVIQASALTAAFNVSVAVTAITAGSFDVYAGANGAASDAVSVVFSVLKL